MQNNISKTKNRAGQGLKERLTCAASGPMASIHWIEIHSWKPGSGTGSWFGPGCRSERLCRWPAPTLWRHPRPLLLIQQVAALSPHPPPQPYAAPPHPASSHLYSTWIRFAFPLLCLLFSWTFKLFFYSVSTIEK